MIKHILHHPALDNLALFHHTHFIGQVINHRQVVRHKQIRQATLTLQSAQQIQHLALHTDIEGTCRLIQNQELWLHRQRTRNRNSLALTTRKLMRIAVKRMRWHPNLAQQRLSTRTTLRVIRIHFMNPHPLHHELRYGHTRIEARKGVLKHNLQLATQRKPLRPAQTNYRTTFVKDIPTCSLEQAKQHHPNRALPRARLADQR